MQFLFRGTIGLKQKKIANSIVGAIIPVSVKIVFYLYLF